MNLGEGGDREYLLAPHRTLSPRRAKIEGYEAYDLTELYLLPDVQVKNLA
jgi:hypothetical protein